ncbi:MAG TPA: RiPP maturation radical SAM C-methyltransferase [Pyrinomonadaceae bacterium]|nr:RiPP maturation radical SAM C-methyltransferase [Pyrinomonadaceae bacterium]
MDVVFAVPPFVDINRPAIGVSLLKAEIARHGFSSRIEYLHLGLAERIGFMAYQTIANSLGSDSLIGEWFFADVVFGNTIPHEREYINKVLPRYSGPGELLEVVLKARQVRHQFVEDCARQILQHEPKVVGFTTTFHTTCASLAIARRIKESPNPPVVIFGGANCEGEMGLQLLRSFNWIDYVCTGEGDVVFPEFLQNLLRDGGVNKPIPGILRQGESTELSTPEPVREMDSLPIPDYSDYFEQVRRSPLQSEIRTDLLIETSRGCWWGAKQHCTFCGLNGATMSFRSKSPERVFEELSYLTETYGQKRIDGVDNILDTKYINTLFPKLSESGLDLELFYEVKANLRYDQLEMLRAGGMRSIQPGIESFSNEVLRLMKKGCTGLQNIQLLRWCDELGIEIAWNLLAGFPDESPSEYQRMAELLPLLTHLSPPASCTPIRLDRFSPFYTRSEEFGLERVRPTLAYYYVYPLNRRELARLAYFFDFDYGDKRQPQTYISEVRQEVQNWWNKRMAAEPDGRARLDAYFDGDAVNITDTRGLDGTQQTCQLTGLAAQLFRKCDSAHGLANLQREFAGLADEEEIQKALAELLAAKLMIEMDGQYLSLAVIRNRQPRQQVEQDNVYSKIQQAETSQQHLRLV